MNVYCIALQCMHKFILGKLEVIHVPMLELLELVRKLYLCRKILYQLTPFSVPGRLEVSSNE